MIDAATSFAKAGYDADTALELGKVATMYQNVADEEINAGDSADFIIAQMKAFNIEASESMHIIDAVNEVRFYGISINRVNCWNPLRAN